MQLGISLGEFRALLLHSSHSPEQLSYSLLFSMFLQLRIVLVVAYAPALLTRERLAPYTISLQNTGTIPANHILVTDTIPIGTSFIQNSVTINNVPQPIANPSTGIPISTLAPSESATISFRVLVTSIPPSGEIKTKVTFHSNTNQMLLNHRYPLLRLHLLQLLL